MSFCTHKIGLIILLFTGLMQISAQECVMIDKSSIQICLQSVVVQEANVKSLKTSPEGSPGHLFYQYFMGTDYPGYKELFRPGEWFNLSAGDFTTWRKFIQTADLRMMGFAEIHAGALELGIVKYTYVMEDKLMYETFLAKKNGSAWYPASVKDEQDFARYTAFVKYINLAYLEDLHSSLSEKTTPSGGQTRGSSSLISEILAGKDSIRVYDKQTFDTRFNPDFIYRTNQKFLEDRQQDAPFKAYLTEMQLSTEQSEIVMKYMLVQDYLGAAQKADDFSPVSYNYMPFVDKIREIYGRDRIAKWDHVNKKWD
jgi:hypothetical protein